MSAKRLQKEYEILQKQPIPWATTSLIDNNLHKWKCTLLGPEKTPYEKGLFVIEMEMPPEYPFKPPTVKFLTKTYHPNIQQKDGQICAEILGKSWSPQIKINEVLLTVRTMLAEPNIDSPLEEDVANEFRSNRKKFDQTAKDWTKKYAKPNKK
eukprot:TRINITY_DN273_c0_g1_i1.p1 TRINITY_DN273_c0_g1~~TRINITY_DN273_c0_g1_i1.p1  ORF type:complete len:153 (+),score=33.84 TRINITY_DN273_c0_g1_i1:66-524(+)